MKYCNNCKADNPEDAQYCHMCGIIFHNKHRNKIVFILGLLGMGIVSVGAGLIGHLFWIGLVFILAGFGLMIWAWINDES